jgi:hypothetical protein
MPDRVHFFSYATGVSIELPVGFTVGTEQAGAVTYVRHEDESVVAVVMIAVLPGAPPDGAALLVDGMAAVGQSQDRAVREIDDERVEVAELRFPNGLPSGGVAAAEPEAVELLGSDLWVTFAAVTFGGRVVTVTAAAPYALAEQYRPAFAAALESCRFIALEAA